VCVFDNPRFIHSPLFTRRDFPSTFNHPLAFSVWRTLLDPCVLVTSAVGCETTLAGGEPQHTHSIQALARAEKPAITLGLSVDMSLVCPCYPLFVHLIAVSPNHQTSPSPGHSPLGAATIACVDPLSPSHTTHRRFLPFQYLNTTVNPNPTSLSSFATSRHNNTALPLPFPLLPSWTPPPNNSFTLWPLCPP
jgi:hypothetical protein